MPTDGQRRTSSPCTRYEDAALGPLTLDGVDKPIWVCRTCQRIYPEWEHGARSCCSLDQPCGGGCGGRNVHEPGMGRYTVCQVCRDRKEEERWEKANKVEPSWPCVIWDDDRYFFDESSLEEWMADEGLTELRMAVCVKETRPIFEMSEFLSDYMPDDDYPDGSFDEQINALIEKASPQTWVPGVDAFVYRLEQEATDA